LLATLHGGSWQDARLARQLGDRTLFDELRIDPYYRTLAKTHADAAPAIEALIHSLAEHPRSLVLGDFSPKNLLISPGGLMMVDFETGHYGDPAFDLGFFLSHLVLKSCHKRPRHAEYLALGDAFWSTYFSALVPRIPSQELASLRRRGVLNFASCGWARLDAKSPVEYLTDPARRDLMRQLCREILSTQPGDWPDIITMCRRYFDA
jgi:5-methylthioribose kinase